MLDRSCEQRCSGAYVSDTAVTSLPNSPGVTVEVTTDTNMAAQAAAPAAKHVTRQFKDKEKPVEVRHSNIVAAKAVADAVRTSLGPKGMDKLIQSGKKGENVVVTNDGATIMKQLSVLHPAARMLVDVSNAQDIEAGDGTTSVVVITGSLLSAAEKLLDHGIHPTVIAESFTRAAAKGIEFLNEMATPIDLKDRQTLLKIASTSLNSKIVSQHSQLLAPIAVDSVLKIVDPSIKENVDLRDIRMVKKVGGTIDDTKMVDGLILAQTVIKSGNGPTSIDNARIALIQFQLSAPKPDMDNQIVVNDYRQMDKILKEERQYILNICKRIAKLKINVVLIQKSILRDAVSDLAIHFLSKLKILAVKDIERTEVEFICKTLGCKPIADVESLSEDKLAFADSVKEVESAGSRVIRFEGIKNKSNTASILIHGSSPLILDETERSLHDAMCVIRCLVKRRALLVGGGAPEIEVCQQLMKYARTLTGMEQYCFEAFAEALIVIPTTLAENAGFNPIAIVTELRNRHAKGEKTTGINVRKGTVSDVFEEGVVQPLYVTTSALQLAAETVKMIMKIDDIVAVR